jgi:hypothetical protein
MSLVSAENIEEPKIKVTPPVWVKAFVGLFLAFLLVIIAGSPIDSVPLKFTILFLYSAVLLRVIRKHIKGNYLVTMQANHHGVYFQTTEEKTYYHLPWSGVGVIEKTIFPLNSRGIRVEVTGDYMAIVKSTDQIGNVKEIENKLYIYTITQLNDRDILIEKLLRFKIR